LLELYGSTSVEKDKWKLDKRILHHDNADQLKEMIVKKKKKKENYIGKVKVHSNHRNLYLIIIKDKILLLFSNAETILRLFESNGKKMLSSEVIFTINTRQLAADKATRKGLCPYHQK
jgi:hypothetical protein